MSHSIWNHFTTCYKNDECQAELSTDAINDILQVQKRKERKTNKIKLKQTYRYKEQTSDWQEEGRYRDGQNM